MQIKTTMRHHLTPVRMATIQKSVGNFLAVQSLGLNALTAGALGSIPGQGTQIPQAE